MLRICTLIVLLLLPVSLLAGPQGVVKVVDADTWDVGGQRVRLHGIDAPELDQTCVRPNGQSWDCGQWASDQVRKRFAGQVARCEAQDVDRYDRIVARCWVNGVDAAREMVIEGWAFAYRKYSMAYDLDEKGAAVNDRGLHASRVQSPADFRRAKVAASAPAKETVVDGNCPIKGNISRDGKRIYHLPGQAHYAKTRINTGKGERWFCSESEARAAGWRKARR